MRKIKAVHWDQEDTFEITLENGKKLTEYFTYHHEDGLVAIEDMFNYLQKNPALLHNKIVEIDLGIQELICFALVKW